VIFYHMPRTGGTSIKTLSIINDKLEFHSNERTSMKSLKQEIDQWTLQKDIVGKGKLVKFIEFHYELEPFITAKDDLARWRRNANENNIPFFVFTVMRDPVTLYVSIFNFFCIYLHKATRVYCPPPHDINRMREISSDNPQARWYCFGTTLALTAKEKLSNTKPINDCASNLPDLMKVHFDWIGIFASLKETCAVFQSMGINLGIVHKNGVTGIKSVIKKRALNTTVIDEIQKEVTVDLELHAWAKSTFTLSNFGIDARILNDIEEKKG